MQLTNLTDLDKSLMDYDSPYHHRIKVNANIRFSNKSITSIAVFATDDAVKSIIFNGIWESAVRLYSCPIHSTRTIVV